MSKTNDLAEFLEGGARVAAGINATEVEARRTKKHLGILNALADRFNREYHKHVSTPGEHRAAWANMAADDESAVRWAIRKIEGQL